MAYEIIPEYNWVVSHPLYTANNQGPLVTAQGKILLIFFHQTDNFQECWPMTYPKLAFRCFFKEQVTSWVKGGASQVEPLRGPRRIGKKNTPNPPPQDAFFGG